MLCGALDAVALRRLVPRCAAFALALLLVAPAADASHYRIVDADFVGDEARVIFERFGYRDTADVLANVATPQRRLALHEATGLSLAELEELAAMCELIQVDGVGPRAARLLRHAGVANVQDLGTREPQALHAALERSQRETLLTSIAPPLQTVEGWIASAAAVPVVVTY